jgi:hypothetical protein
MLTCTVEGAQSPAKLKVPQSSPLSPQCPVNTFLDTDGLCKRCPGDKVSGVGFTSCIEPLSLRVTGPASVKKGKDVMLRVIIHNRNPFDVKAVALEVGLRCPMPTNSL